jgi:hypothetical protein
MAVTLGGTTKDILLNIMIHLLYLLRFLEISKERIICSLHTFVIIIMFFILIKYSAFSKVLYSEIFKVCVLKISFFNLCGTIS